MTSAKVEAARAELFPRLWGIADTLRGQMDSSDYQKYILGFIFYRFLSETTVATVENGYLDEDEENTFDEAMANEKLCEAVSKQLRKDNGFVIKPQHLYDNVLEEMHADVTPNTDLLQEAFNEIIKSSNGAASHDDFEGLFTDISLTSTALGGTPKERALTIRKVMGQIADIELHINDTEIDILGDAYEYLLSQFASTAGKKGGEFYTPQTVSSLLSSIVTHENPDFTSAYDPTCGSGSLLMRVYHDAPENRRQLVAMYGQELNSSTYNLARMNMILHKIKFTNFNIRQGNTLTNDRHADLKVDVAVANPPYSAEWDNENMETDARYVGYGVAPKNKADYAFVLGALSHLKEDGSAAIVLPHGPLFRGGAEGRIRTQLIENNLVHAVIGLPENLFYGTSIATCIMVFKKNRDEGAPITIIDASQEYKPGKNANHLEQKNLDRILEAYTSPEAIDKLSAKVDVADIVANDYNLNIARYVDTSEPEKAVNLVKIGKKLAKNDRKVEDLNEAIARAIAELEGN